jgi:tRNA(fMet)-specific endonuclease VapC
MVKAELLHGAEKSANPEANKELVSLFIAPFEIVAFDDKASAVYAQIRSELERIGNIIGFNDLIIAATVIANEGTLVSRNIKEFNRIKRLQLEPWVELP